MGDPTRTLQTAKQVEIIKKNDLVSHTASIGSNLYSELERMVQRVDRGKMSGLRGKGQGTFIAWDMPSSAIRDKFCSTMRSQGVNIGSVSNASAIVLVG